MVLTYKHIAENNKLLRYCGGKGSNLFLLRKHGFQVPPFIILPGNMIREILHKELPVIQKLLTGLKYQGDERILELTAEIHQRIRKVSINPDLKRAIYEAVDAQLKNADAYAVRSSVTLEDSVKSSFAGLFVTSLGVKKVDLGKAVMQCIQSMFTPQALKYSVVKDIDPLQNEMAVVIQEMVDASVSGIVFTMNATGNFNDVFISAGLGCGEGIVSNNTDTTAYFINRQTCDISIGGGDPSVLNQQQIRQVFDEVLKIEKVFGLPQDIEFSFDKQGNLFILQARPITTIDITKLKILDNSNIVESYPGITLPLTFTFAKNGYQKVFTAALRLFMIHEREVTCLGNELEAMITHVNGRIYYNLHHWYRIVQVIIVSQNSMQAWETLIGIKSKSKARIKFRLAKKVKSFYVTLHLLVSYKKMVRQFYSDFDAEYGKLRKFADDLKFNNPDASEVFTFYQDVSGRLFNKWAPTIVNDFFTLKFFDLLNRMVLSFGFEAKDNTTNDLLCGIPGVESERPVIELLRLKEMVLVDAVLKALFEKDTQSILKALEKEDFINFNEQVKEFIRLYGDRTLEELKLESPNFRMNPGAFIDLIKSQLINNNTPQTFVEKQERIRSGAELKIRKKGNYPKQLLFAYILSRTREAVKNRENMRLRRAMSYGVVKELFLYNGTKMASESLIADPYDVFYLTIAELERYCRGTKISNIALVQERKEVYQRFAQQSLPDRIVHNAPEPPVAKQGEALHLFKDGLSGTGISKGQLTAEAIVLSKPDFTSPVDGKILITRMTDPAWVFLMIRAAGLISEKGSPLSHTAIVGRELGIPVIIGVPNATTIIKTGDIISMDGDKGSVEVQG